MRIVAILAAVVVLVSTATCALLPEEYAVNAPLRQMLFARGVGSPDATQVETRFRAPEGFGVGVFADDLPNARWMLVSEAGDLLVSTPRSGRVWLLERDADGDGRADGRRILLDDLDRPHGLAVHRGWLYVAETGRVLRVPFAPGTGEVGSEREVVVSGLPEGGNHWTRTIEFGPDGQLYVSVGSSCNVCLEEDPRRASILRFAPDGSDVELFASGLRNAVGFDWQPGTGHLYATDNGRDLLGDDFPPCELNRVVAGGFYGWPFANGDRVPDPDLGAGRTDAIAASRAPAHGFRAHNAPLGIHFVQGHRVPPRLRGAALVALHGSWNRTSKDGYKVVSLHWNRDGSISEQDFLVGFLEGERVYGRPVDVAEGRDGSFFVSDDYSGTIYRVAYGEDPIAATGQAPSRDALPTGREQIASLPDGEREARRARGEALWERWRCAQCHQGERADEGVVVVPLQDLGGKHTIETLRAFLAAPTPPMPLLPLDAQERADLAVFLLARHPGPAR